MKANKHEINGYIYVTSDEKIKVDDFVVTNYQYNNKTANKIYGMTPNGMYSDIGYEIMTNRLKKIILCNNPNLSIQQLTTEEVEYLKGVDSFEVKKINLCIQTGLPCGMQCLSKETCNKNNSYKILIPQETEQPKGLLFDAIKEVIKDKLEQTKESIFTSRYQDLFNYLHDLGVITLESELQEIERIVLAKQTLYTEDEVLELLEKSKLTLLPTKEWFNKHKKQKTYEKTNTTINYFTI